MTDMANAIMDAAEKRIRHGGFGGFSFREIAADVGVKSSSVHYHFPTKEDLTAAVIDRYAGAVADDLDKALRKEKDPIRAWARAFGGTVHSKLRMCPASVLGAERCDLPPKVAIAVKRFFQMHLDKLMAAGLPADRAAVFLSQITGAMLIANAMGDPSFYDQATAELVEKATAA